MYAITQTLICESLLVNGPWNTETLLGTGGREATTKR